MELVLTLPAMLQLRRHMDDKADRMYVKGFKRTFAEFQARLKAVLQCDGTCVCVCVFHHYSGYIAVCVCVNQYSLYNVYIYICSDIGKALQVVNTIKKTPY